MKSTITKLPKSQIAIAIEVTPEEVIKLLPEAAKRLSQKLKLAGFRPGKAPLEIVKQKVGEGALWEEAAQAGLPHFYTSVVMNEKLEPIGQPKVTIKQIAPNNPLIFTVEVAVLPTFDLPNYKDLTVKVEPVKIEDGAVEKTLEELRRMRAEYKSVERPAQKGDRVEVNFSITKDGQLIDGGQSKNHPIVLGEGHFVPGFEENLIGLTKNQEKKFDLTYPKDYKMGGLAGATAQVVATLTLIQEVILPEMTDEFAKKLGKFESVEDLKKKIMDGVKTEAEAKEKQRFELAMLDALLAKLEVELPDVLVEGEKDKMLEEFARDIASRGMELEQYLEASKTTLSELRATFTTQAEKRVRIGLLLRAIAKKENIAPSDDEVQKALNDTLAMYQNNEQAKKQLSSPEYRDFLKSRLTNDKVLEFLVQNTKKK